MCCVRGRFCFGDVVVVCLHDDVAKVEAQSVRKDYCSLS